MRKFITVAVIAVLSAANLLRAQDFEVGGLYYDILSVEEKTVQVARHPVSCYQGSYTVPARVTYQGEEYVVQAIGDLAFYNGTNLKVTIEPGIREIGKSAFALCDQKELTVPSTVTTICTGAFADNAKLTTLTLEEGIKEIGDIAFADCSSLRSILLPASLEKLGDVGTFDRCNVLTSIGVAAGNNCFASVQGVLYNKDKTVVIRHPQGKSLKTLKLPSSVTEIGPYAFSGLSALSTVEIPEQVRKIGTRAFAKCGRLTTLLLGSVETIGEGAFAFCNSLDNPKLGTKLTSIPANTFDFCHNLKTIDIPASVTELGDCSFYDCWELDNISFSGPGLKSIGEKAFYGAVKVAKFDIPSTVEEIDSLAFVGCPLTEITLPDALRKLGGRAFWACQLQTINIPAGLTEIGLTPFMNIPTLVSVNVDPANPAYSSENGVLFNKNKTKLIQYPGGNPRTEYICPTRVSEITEGAFCGAYRLKSLSLSDGLRKIGEGAFNLMSALQTLVFPDGISEIPPFVCNGCNSLAAVKIPEGCLSVGRSAFEASGLKSCILPATVKSIGASSFASCRKLGQFDFGHVGEIGDSAFFSAALSDVIFPETLRHLGKYAFHKSNIKKVVINGGLKHVGACAFFITALESVEFQEGVESIGQSCFMNSKLSGVRFPSSLKTIQSAAFADCKYLAEIEFAEGLDSICSSAFSKCTALTGIDLPNSLTVLGVSPFWYCDGLRSVSLGSGLKEIGHSAFNPAGTLQSVRCAAETPPVMKMYEGEYNNFTADTYSRAVLMVPEESVEAYRAAPGWNRFKSIEGLSGVEEIMTDDPDAYVEVYDQAGLIVFRGRNADIQLPSGGIYVVRSGGKSYKRVKNY